MKKLLSTILLTAFAFTALGSLPTTFDHIDPPIFLDHIDPPIFF